MAALAIAFIVVGSGSGLMKLPASCLIVVFFLLFNRTLSRKQAMGSISGKTLLVIGAGFGLTKALVKTGVASVVAGGIAGISSGGDNFVALLFGVFICTAGLANLISPSAAVSLMFPVAFEIPATHAQYKSEPVLGVLMIAGSCAFLSPYSYTTNLMVTEVAGYKIVDFLKLGGPLLLLLAAMVAPLSTKMWGDCPGCVD